MFGPKAYGWKLGAAVATAAALFAAAAWKGPEIKPSLRQALARPDLYDGRDLWFRAQADADGASLEIDGLRMPVRGLPAEAAGRLVEAVAVFRAGGAPLEIRRWRFPARRPQRGRRLVEAVSAAALLAVLANFLAHFAFRPSNLRVREEA